MVLTKVELENNRAFNKYAFEIVNEILTLNDKALVANLLDFSKKIIVDANHLRKLILLVVDDEIEFVTDVEVKSCDCKCCKVKTHIYENIENILIGGKEMKDVEPELYKYISEELNISLNRTYASQIIEIEKKSAIIEEEEKEVTDSEDISE